MIKWTKLYCLTISLLFYSVSPLYAQVFISPFFPFYFEGSRCFKIEFNPRMGIKNIDLNYGYSGAINAMKVEYKNKETVNYNFVKICSQGYSDSILIGNADLPNGIKQHLPHWDYHNGLVEDHTEIQQINSSYKLFKSGGFNRIANFHGNISQLYIISKDDKKDTLIILLSEISYSNSYINRNIQSYKLICKNNYSDDSIRKLVLEHHIESNGELIRIIGARDTLYRILNKYEWELSSSAATALDCGVFFPYLILLDSGLSNLLFKFQDTCQVSQSSQNLRYIGNTYSKREISELSKFNNTELNLFSARIDNKELSNKVQILYLKPLANEYIVINNMIVANLTLKRKKNKLKIKVVK